MRFVHSFYTKFASLLLDFFHGLSALFTFEGKSAPNSLILQVRKRSGFLSVHDATY